MFLNLIFLLLFKVVMKVSSMFVIIWEFGVWEVEFGVMFEIILFVVISDFNDEELIFEDDVGVILLVFIIFVLSLDFVFL